MKLIVTVRFRRDWVLDILDIYIYIYSTTQPRWLNLPSLYHQRFRRLGSKIPDALNVVFCSGSNISSNVACRQQFSTWFHGFVDDLQMPCQNMPWNHLCVLSASRLEFLFVSQMNFELYPPVCPLLSRSIGSTGLPWNDAITIQILSSPPEIWHVSNITRPVDWTWNFERSCPPGQLLGSLWVSEILVIPKAEIDWQHFSVWECEWPRNALETGGVSSWKMCGGTFLDIWFVSKKYILPMHRLVPNCKGSNNLIHTWSYLKRHRRACLIQKDHRVVHSKSLEGLATIRIPSDSTSDTRIPRSLSKCTCIMTPGMLPM